MEDGLDTTRAAVEADVGWICAVGTGGLGFRV